MLLSFLQHSLPDAVSFCTLNCSHKKKSAQNTFICAKDFLGLYLSLPNLQLSFQSVFAVFNSSSNKYCMSINPMQKKNSGWSSDRRIISLMCYILKSFLYISVFSNRQITDWKFYGFRSSFYKDVFQCRSQKRHCCKYLTTKIEEFVVFVNSLSLKSAFSEQQTQDSQCPQCLI